MAHCIIPKKIPTTILLSSLICFLFLQSCHEPEELLRTTEKIKLDKATAGQLLDLPIECIQKSYPYKLGQVLGDSSDLKEPVTLHPAFYGCFDWHSAVHGHWSIVKLLKEYPQLEKGDLAKTLILENLSKENILVEVDYFKGKYNASFERTYGWAWLLKLAEELHTWDDPLAIELEANLQPLTDLIVERYIEFLPKLLYPIRVGEHSNTAFGLSFAWDFAHTVGDAELKKVIEEKARSLYLNDASCPLNWEPSGYDFLSPCLEELDIMRRVLGKTEFDQWLRRFLPQMRKGFSIMPADVSDREDGKLVHLDGLNFSRAWVLYGLANQYPEYSYLNSLGSEHISYSLPNLISDSYEGGHWLGSFAIYALSS
ncbi:MAG: DUF2891 domain-containing protein [Bacteroidota bacterium]